MLMKQSKYKLWLVAVIVTFIDMLSKVLVKNFILLGEKVSIIPKVFYLTYVKNTGAAWSIFQNKTIFIIIFTTIVIAFLIYYLIRQNLNSIEMIGYGMVLGGAVGNLFDRIFYGYVIDFIDIYIFGYDYPVFNIADIAIVVGVIVLLIGMLRSEKNETNSKASDKN